MNFSKPCGENMWRTTFMKDLALFTVSFKYFSINYYVF